MSIDGKKAIVYVHGNNMTIGEAFEFLTRIDCNEEAVEDAKWHKKISW